MNKKIIFSTLAVILIFGGLIWYVKTKSTQSPGEIISRNGLHWHAELIIYKNGVQQTIPANVGIGAVHQPIHNS